MNKKVKLYKYKGHNIVDSDAIIKELQESDLDSFRYLQDIILSNLSTKEIFQPEDEESLSRFYNKKLRILGCYYKSKLIAYAIMLAPVYDNDNLGLVIGLDQSLLPEVIHFESAAVHPDYRGNNLQFIFGQVIEELALKEGYKHICATASPNNAYSIQNLKKLGYKIVLEKTMYGGKRRYIFHKTV